MSRGKWVALTVALAASVLVLPSAGSASSSDPSTLDFGTVGLNTSKTLSATLTIDAGYSYGGASGVSGLNPPFQYDHGTCTGTTSGTTCQISETFTPTSPGPASGEVDPFECPTGGGQCISLPIQLQGSGRTPSADPSTLDFGTVGLNTSKTLSATLTIDAGYSYGGASGVSGLNPPFHYGSGTCTGTTSGTTCQISETFTPTSPGPASGEVDPFECPNGGGQCISIPIQLQGSGRTPTADPSTLDFGTVALNTSKTLSATLTIDAGYSYGGASGVSGLNPPFHYGSGTCTGTTSGTTCQISETFTPTATGGATGQVDPFECPNGGGQCIAIPVNLTGTGVSVAAADPATLDFGDVPLNTSKTLTSTLTIDAGYSYGGASGVSGLNPPFHYGSGTCTGATSGTTCQISETFTPTATGGATGQVDPFECPNGGGQCIAIPVNLTGTGVSVAAASPSTLDFGDVPLNTSKTLTSTLTIDAGYSYGGASGVSGLNPPFHYGSGTCTGATTGTTCQISETFTPTATGGATGQVDPFECPNGGGQCIAIPVNLTGTGVRVTTTTTVSSSANPSFIGQSVTFTATVGGASDAHPATGSVTFTDGTTTLGTVPLSNGSAALTTSSLPVGTHSITAAYSGDGTYAPSSGAVSQTVQLYPSTTTLQTAPNPSVASFPVTLTATVTGSGTAAPTGTVTFTAGAATLGTVPVAGGSATLQTSALPAGSDQVTATYSGDARYAGSTATRTQVVQAIATTTSLAGSSVSSAAGDPVTFTATVSRQLGSAPITGSVTFTDGTTVLGTSPIVDGAATLTTSALALGHHVVTATYSGDTVYASSTGSHVHNVHPSH